MSKSRMEAKVRKNPDFEACTKFLDGLGLKWEVLPPSGSGHPRLSILLPSGNTYLHPIPCTPRTKMHPGKAVSKLKHRLAEVLGK